MVLHRPVELAIIIGPNGSTNSESSGATARDGKACFSNRKMDRGSKTAARPDGVCGIASDRGGTVQTRWFDPGDRGSRSDSVGWPTALAGFWNNLLRR